MRGFRHWFPDTWFVAVVDDIGQVAVVDSGGGGVLVGAGAWVVYGNRWWLNYRCVGRVHVVGNVPHPRKYHCHP